MNDDTIKLIAGLLKMEGPKEKSQYDNGMIGKYVLVRCKDAGVHAGELVSHHNRECVLTNARRLWYWKPADGAAFLSGVSSAGLDSSSKVGRIQSRLHLTETCEIAQCSFQAEESIRQQGNYNE